MTTGSRWVRLGAFALAWCLGAPRVLQGQRGARSPGAGNVVLVVLDGVRWQEVFRGGDCALMDRADGGVEDTAALRRRFCRSDRDSARAALLPFLWGTMAREGALFGDRDTGSDAHVTNPYWFSYPGYSEMITGAADARVNSNNFGPNPNVSVFEWLARRPGFEGRVRVWGTWDAFDRIFNEARAGIPVRSGWETPFPVPANDAQRELDALYATTTRWWGDVSPDAFLMRDVLQSLAWDRPRALFVGFGESDEWAHARRYDHYLGSIRDADGYLAQLWAALQASPRYRGSTTLIVLCDHGRGRTPRDWTDHGRDVPGADEIWLGAIGPGVPPLGVVRSGPPLLQAQVAATVAASVGERFTGVNTRAAPAVDFSTYLTTAPTRGQP